MLVEKLIRRTVVLIALIDSDDIAQPDLESDANIRSATSEDAVSIHRVMKVAFIPLTSRGYSEKAIIRTVSKPWKIRDRILSDSLVLVAEIDNEVVGTVTGTEEYERMRVNSLAVNPLFQCRGIGTKLLNTLESVARENGHHKLVLETAWSMTEAIRLYQNLGYRKEGYLRRHYFGEDFVVFSKYLFQEDDENWSSSDRKHKALHYLWPSSLY
jgi:ribosomal protein S18 acetylase RimI-like enzyme